jgi:hypothetical protein
MKGHTRGLVGVGHEARLRAAGDCETAGVDLPDGIRASGRGARSEGRGWRKASDPRENQALFGERAGRNAESRASQMVQPRSRSRRWVRVMTRLENGQ